MLPGMHTVNSLKQLLSIVHDLLLDGIRLLLLGSHSKAALKAENLSMANYYGDRFWGSPRCEGEASPTL
jgi:hypothetical protein